MSEREALLQSLRDSGLERRNAETAQFREDFKFVLRRWRELGEISQAEYEDDYRVMSESIRAHAHDEAWMNSCRLHFAQIATDMRADIERSQRIQCEEREAA